MKIIRCLSVKKRVEDSMGWIFNSDGRFSISSFRSALEEQDVAIQASDMLPWKGLTPPKVELFLWQLLKGRVMVGNVLKRFGLSLAMRCLFCKADKESLSHVFLHCPWSWKIWKIGMSW